MTLSRRDLSLLLPAIAAQTPANAQTTKEKPVLPAKSYPYSELPVKTNGENQTRAVFDGATHTGYPVELHITRLGPGLMPHPPHKHVHEEILTLKNGQLDIIMGGTTTRITAGSVVMTASMQEHGWKNPGPDPAEYFVIALGPKS
jgi:mannose-6-phosphate isomerase-like protein (cupin superfamily)